MKVLLTVLILSLALSPLCLAQADRADSINSLLLEAERHFSSVFASVEHIRYSTPAQTGDKACLRTGYHFEQKRINFCGSDYVKNGGMNSRDVIFHEAFHAMLCQLRPDWCTDQVRENNQSLAIHEALADFFARTVDSTNYFGEEYYRTHPWIRPYQNDLLLSLAKNPYHLAGSLNRVWKQKNLSLISFRDFIYSGQLSLSSLRQFNLLPENEVIEPSAIIPVQGVISPIDRYRLPATGALFKLQVPSGLVQQLGKLQFSLIDEAGHETVDYDLDIEGEFLRISPRSTWKRARYFIQLKNSNGKIIGLFPLYLSLRK